jgi:hypothetical protein
MVVTASLNSIKGNMRRVWNANFKAYILVVRVPFLLSMIKRNYLAYMALAFLAHTSGIGIPTSTAGSCGAVSEMTGSS